MGRSTDIKFVANLKRSISLSFCALAAISAASGAITQQISRDTYDFLSSTSIVIENGDIKTQLMLLSSVNGRHAKDCGTAEIAHPAQTIPACVQSAFQAHEPFHALYTGWEYAFFQSAYGLAGDDRGNVFRVEFDSRGLLNLGAIKMAKVSHKNQIRVTPCIKPTRLGTTEDGIVGCIRPVNEEESEAAAHQKTIETTVCAILQHPAVFNNKLVRIHGYASGNFEYSELSGGGCSDSLWLAYGNGDGPPGLVAFINGGARPGTEDSEGRYIKPIPVKLVQDSNFQRFQTLMEAREKADEDSMKQHSETITFHRVSATFIGRIDGVPDDIHAFHLKRKESDRVDYLGFGQMGLFDAQFVMQSVEGDAVLEALPPIQNPFYKKPN